MSRKPENTFRAGVHKYLPPELHHEKMNNPYSAGTPDDWFSGNRADLWIEYKYLKTVPVRAVIKPFELLSALQLRWLNERYKEGRNVCVVIGCPNGGIILRDEEWQWEYTSQMFSDRLLPRKEIAGWISQQTMRP